MTSIWLYTGRMHFLEHLTFKPYIVLYSLYQYCYPKWTVLVVLTDYMLGPLLLHSHIASLQVVLVQRGWRHYTKIDIACSFVFHSLCIADASSPLFALVS